MSMLAATVAPSARPDIFWFAMMAVLFGLSIGIGAWTGLMRPSLVAGPSRLGNQRGALSTLALILGLALLVWLSTQAFYGMYLQFTRLKGMTHPSMLTEADFTAFDWAFLATVPPALGFLTLIGSDYLLLGEREGISRLGLGTRVWSGISAGAVGILVTLPGLEALSSVVEKIYSMLNYAHPQEHQLLKIMGDTSNPVLSMVLIGGAVLFAPFFEEYLFRGHLQTCLRELLSRLTAPRASPPATIAADGAVEVAYATSEPGVKAKPGPLQTWGAIIITSTAFAMVHPRWMWPEIFCLSLCLGYAYERTSNLWASIAMHALFNGVSTALYLGIIRHGNS